MKNRDDMKARFSLISRAPSQPDDRMVRIGSLFPVKKPDAPAPQELFWTCPSCGPIEPLALPTGRWIKRSCVCQRKVRHEQEKAAKHQEWMDMQKVRTYGGWLGSSWEDKEVAREMSTKTFANYDRSRFPSAFDQALAFANNPKGNIIFYGGYGTGKTHLEAAICNHLREQGKPSLFVSAPQFFRAYNDSMKATDQTKHLSIVQQAIESPLLILDDIDKSRPTEARLDTYYLVLDERYKAKRPTVLSTNKYEDLSDYIGEALVSRISSRSVLLRMTGSDYRTEEEEY